MPPVSEEFLKSLTPDPAAEEAFLEKLRASVEPKGLSDELRRFLRVPPQRRFRPPPPPTRPVAAIAGPATRPRERRPVRATRSRAGPDDPSSPSLGSRPGRLPGASGSSLPRGPVGRPHRSSLRNGWLADRTRGDCGPVARAVAWRFRGLLASTPDGKLTVWLVSFAQRFDRVEVAARVGSRGWSCVSPLSATTRP
jgi:hypothetical protein